MRFSNGSMWMSEARSCTASVMISCTSRTIGALVSSIVLLAASAVVDRFGEVDGRVGELLQHRVGAFADRLAVVAVDGLEDRLAGGQGDVDLPVENEPQLVERVDVHRVADDHRQPAVPLGQRNDGVFPRDRLGHQFDDRRRDRRLRSRLT